MQIFIKGLHRGHRGVRTSPFFYRHCAALICNCTKAIPWDLRDVTSDGKKTDGLKTCCKRNFVEKIYVWIGKEILHTKFTHVLYKMFIMIVLTCTFLFSLRVVRWHFIAGKERSQDQSCGKLWNSRTLSKTPFCHLSMLNKKTFYLLAWFPYCRQYVSIYREFNIKDLSITLYNLLQQISHVWVNYIINPCTNLDFPFPPTWVLRAWWDAEIGPAFGSGNVLESQGNYFQTAPHVLDWGNLMMH